MIFLMLEPLFGNKSITKILIFLFVNGKCYGTQLHRLLKTPLTPIQQALSRLEKGGIVSSTLEGKTRIYRLSETYPLLTELEQLLKKAYTLLSPLEKKHYAVLGLESKERSHGNRQILFACWERLAKVNQLTFHSKSKAQEESGWQGKGRGEVVVIKENDNAILFNEKGNWQGKDTDPMGFSNVFRWSLDSHAGIISLEHLRRGLNSPVFLFHLAPACSHSLASVDSHFCEGDVYFGQLQLDRNGLRLNWRVIGPKKNEEIDYFYI